MGYWMAMVAGTLAMGATVPGNVEFAPGPDGRQRMKIVAGDIVSLSDCRDKVLPTLAANLEKLGFKVDVQVCLRPTQDHARQ